jgi:hypothetical protein
MSSSHQAKCVGIDNNQATQIITLEEQVGGRQSLLLTLKTSDPAVAAGYVKGGTYTVSISAGHAESGPVPDTNDA